MKKTILLVEDELIVAMGETALLEKHGMKVINAKNGLKAIEMVEMYGDGIDLILMDIDLGSGIDGTITAKEILKTHNIPIVFLSSHMEKEIVDKTEAITNYGYVVKNSGNFVLLASIKMAFKLFQAQEKHKENNAKYHNMVSSVPGIVYRCSNDDQWTMEFISDEVYNITGYSPKDFIGNKKRSYASIIHPDDIQKVNNTVQIGVENKQQFEIQYRICTKTGAIVYVHERGQGIFDKNGNLLWLDGIITDITAIKETKQLLRKQLKEKENLLIEIHHRIKNNIYSIATTLKLQLDSTVHKESQHILMDTINRLDSMRIIYDKILLNKNYSNVSVHQYLEELIKAIASIYPDKNKIIFKKQFADFNLEVSTLFSLGAIVNELITNSMKYAFNNQQSGKVIVSIVRQNNNVSLVVEDDGMGYPKDFDFDNASSFGLMIVNILTEQLNGTMDIKNEQGAHHVLQFNLDKL